jgi:hypothetical protein
VDPTAGSDVQVKRNISCPPRNSVIAVAEPREKSDVSQEW